VTWPPRSISRLASVWLSLGAISIGLLPASTGYRCQRMGTVMSAPCCEHVAEAAATGTRAIAAACCERVSRVVVAAPAVREVGRVPSSPPLAIAYILRALTPHDFEVHRTSALWLRAGPPDPRLRIPTVVLRV
jgi:hypothetical protein